MKSGYPHWYSISFFHFYRFPPSISQIAWGCCSCFNITIYYLLLDNDIYLKDRLTICIIHGLMHQAQDPWHQLIFMVSYITYILILMIRILWLCLYRMWGPDPLKLVPSIGFGMLWFYSLSLKKTLLLNTVIKWKHGGLSTRGTLWQDYRDIGQEKMWPLKHNSEEMDGKAEEKREDKGEGKVLEN